MSRQFGLDGGDQRARLIVNRTLAAERIIVFRYFQHAFARDVFSAQYIFEEGHYVVCFLWSAEGYY